jgi:AcrR family transcriptional regulator
MPKIAAPTIAEHRELVRHRLFAAFAELMRERGYDAITLADVAAAAGVSRTAIYNHVRDKETLLVDFASDQTTRYVEALTRAMVDTDDPIRQLEEFIRNQVKLRRVYLLAPGPSLSTLLSSETRNQMRHHAELVENLLRGILTRGISSGVFADQNVDIAVALINACVAGRRNPDIDTDAVIAFVLRAVGATTA